MRTSFGCILACVGTTECAIPISIALTISWAAITTSSTLTHSSWITTPPTLSEVARSVGLNEYKLKRGFKETFGTTVFSYLTEQRLESAKRLLLDTDKTASEVGFELGYATAQHFHHAFKNRFGVTPNSMRRKSENGNLE